MNFNDLRLRTKSFIPLAALALTMAGVVALGADRLMDVTTVASHIIESRDLARGETRAGESQDRDHSLCRRRRAAQRQRLGRRRRGDERYRCGPGASGGIAARRRRSCFPSTRTNSTRSPERVQTLAKKATAVSKASSALPGLDHGRELTPDQLERDGQAREAGGGHRRGRARDRQRSKGSERRTGGRERGRGSEAASAGAWRHCSARRDWRARHRPGDRLLALGVHGQDRGAAEAPGRADAHARRRRSHRRQSKARLAATRSATWPRRSRCSSKTRSSARASRRRPASRAPVGRSGKSVTSRRNERGRGRDASSRRGRAARRAEAPRRRQSGGQARKGLLRRISRSCATTSTPPPPS